MSLVSFGSDNHAGVHPQLMDEMLKVNQGYAPSYEQDDISRALKQKIKSEFNAQDSAMVFNGTAANVICLQVALESYHAVLCADTSHLALDECGAPEKIAGVKLITLPTEDGKIKIDSIEKAIVRKGDQHHSQIKMISITQPTEYGTVYSFAELDEIHNICKRNNLYLHIDGARLANAAVTLNCDFKKLTEYADVVSFGGAKNGLLLGEFVIVKNKSFQKSLKHLRKQSLQLPSKTRFLAAPFLKYLDSALWQEIAQHENNLALKLREGLKSILDARIQITQPTQANSVFCTLPKSIIKDLRKEYFFYIWDEKTFEVRLMTSFATTPEQVDGFIAKLRFCLNKG